MKQIVAAAATTFLLMGAAPAGAVSAHAYAVQSAQARWSAIEDGQRVFYFAMAVTGYREGAESLSEGAIGRAECTRVSHHGDKGWSCRGRTEMVPLGPGDFVVHPALDFATLRITQEGVSNSVTWTAKDAYGIPYFHQHAGLDVGVQVMAASFRRASISGTVGGVEVAAKGGGRLWQGFDVNIYPDLGMASDSFRVEEGVVHFRARLHR